MLELLECSCVAMKEVLNKASLSSNIITSIHSDHTVMHTRRALLRSCRFGGLLNLAPGGMAILGGGEAVRVHAK